MKASATTSITREAIEEHVEAVLRSAVFEDSPKASELLRYLVNASLADSTPHEIDIAVDVYGKGPNYDPAECSSVRVYVHQLRRKLDAYYADHATASPIRLRVPKGSYRMSFGVPLVPSPATAPAHARPAALTAGLAAVSALLLISLGANVLLIRADRPSVDAVATLPVPPPLSFVWSDLGEGAEPILIALGDFFFFRDSSRYPDRTHFIRDIEINSAEDLRRFAVAPDGPSAPYGPSVRPSSMTYLPKATAFALEAVLPIVARLGKPVSLKLMSEVSGEDLRRDHVIYIGFVRSMGALQDYFFQTSSFFSESPFLELHHKGTGDIFAAEGDVYGQIEDYGLFSKAPGPGRGKVLVFTGIHDVGILHAVRALTDPEHSAALELDLARGAYQGGASVEVLFKVSGYNRTDLEATVAMISAEDE